MKKYLILLLKLILSAALLTFLFYKVDLSTLSLVVRQSEWPILFLCIILYALGQILSTYKWSLLIHSHGIKHPFGNMVSYYYVGMFFNLFMPSIVGGDIQRCYAVYRDEKRQFAKNPPRGRLSQIISSVLMERLSGLIAMIWLAVIAFFFFPMNNVSHETVNGMFLRHYLPIILIVLALGTVLVFLVLMLWRSSEHQMDTPKTIHEKVIQMINNLAIQSKSYLQSFDLLIKVMVIAFLFQTLFIVLNIFVGYSLHLPVPIGYYFVMVPLVTLCTAIPISLSGLGVREGAYAYFLHFMGVDTTHAILLSFSIVIVVAVNALVGGLILFKKGFQIEKDVPREI